MTSLAAGSVWTNTYLIAIIVYLLALVGVGVYKTKAVKDSEDFMVAGRSLPWYILVGTLLATWIGSGSLFSGAGLGYRNGPAGMWSSGGAWLGILLVFFIARRIRNFGKVTIPDIFQARYGSPAAVLATITTVIAYLTIVSYQFRGGGKVLSIITEGGVSEETGIVITAVFAITYTVLAGMFSVVYTDVVNGVLMTFGTLLGLFWIVDAVGGTDELMAAADAAGKWSLWGNWGAERTSGTSGPVIALSFFVPTMLLLLGDANMYQRIFSAKDGISARKAVAFWVVGVIVLEAAVSFLGLAGAVAAEKEVLAPIVQQSEDVERERLLAGDEDAEVAPVPPEDIEAALALLSGPHSTDFAASTASPEVKAVAAALHDARKSGSEGVIPAIALKLPLLLGMLLVATMMAIIVSTADSFLLIPATNLTRDVYQRMRPDAAERVVLLVSRGLVLVLGAVAFMLVWQFRTVLDAAFTAYNIYGASITPALLAAFLWKRATLTGAVSSIVTGAGVTLLWTYGGGIGFPDPGGFHPFFQEPTFPAAGLSILALLIGSIATPAPPKEVWSQFFDDGTGATGPLKKPQRTSFYDLDARSLEGEAAPLSAYAGQVTLVVNLASECGYTPQYEGLQALHAELEARGFAVLGFPSNEFGGQEPGDAAAIRAFCTERYQVGFPLFEKCRTKQGAHQSPVYALLGAASGALPNWNFCKYLVGRDGMVISFHESAVAPDDPELRAAIEVALGG